MADNKNKIIGATVKLDTSQASTSAKALNKDLRDVKGSLKDTGTTAKATGKDIDSATGSFSNIKSQLSAMPSALGGATQGVGSLNTALKSLLANPLALVIAGVALALRGLYKAFTATAEGADTAEQYFAGVSAVLEVLVDRAALIAKSFLAIFRGDFKEAAQLGRQAFTGIGDDIVAEFGKAKEGTRIMQEVEDTTRDLAKSRAILNRDLAATKEIVIDETASLKDKQKAIKEVGEAEAKQTEAELANAKKKLEAIKLIQGNRDLSDEDMDERTQAEIEITQLEEKSAAIRRDINQQTNTVNREARAKEQAERAAAIEKEKQDAMNLAAFQNKLAKLKSDNELLAIKNERERAAKQLEIKIEEERRANVLLLREKKISQEQFNQLDAAAQINANLQRAALKEKEREDEVAFQKELNDIINKTKLLGLTDARAAEKLQLDIEQEQRLAEAVERYKNDQVKFNAIKAQLDLEFAAEQEQLKAKHKEEDDKKELDRELARQQAILEANNYDFEAKRAALDAEQQLIQAAFDNKILTEEQYNQKTKALTDARNKIKDEEKEHNQKVAGAISTTLGNLANIAGKQTVLGKAFSIAQTAIDTYTGAIAAYKSMAGIPVVGPALGAVAAAAAIKNGLDAVKRITAVDVPGQGKGSGVGSLSGLSISAPLKTAAPLTPTPTSTRIIDTGENNALNRPIRTYVVEQDNAAAAERAERLRRASVLGG